MEAKLKDSLLPEDMKRELIMKGVESRFPGRMPENHNLEPHPHNNRQVYENPPPAIQRMPMNNPHDDMRFQRQRGDARLPSQMARQLPPQMQMDIQNQRKSMIGNQRMKQAQNQMGVPMPGQLPPQINPQVKRMDMPGGHMPMMNKNPPVRQDLNHMGRNFNNSREKLVPNSMPRGVYNSPNVPPSRGHPGMDHQPREHPQRGYSVSPSARREAEHPVQRDRMAAKARSFAYNQAKVQGGLQPHHQVAPKPLPEEEIGDENFFPK